MAVTRRPRSGGPGRRLVAIALVGAALGTTACGAGKPSVLASRLASTPPTPPTTPTTLVVPGPRREGTSTTAASTGGASTARPGTPTTTATGRTTTAPGATTATGAGTSGGQGANRCAAEAASPLRDAAPTLPDGRVATSAAIGVRMAYPAAWPLTDLTVTASQVLEPRLVPAVGLQDSSPLKPLTVRAPAQYPGVAVFRLKRPKQDVAYVAAVTREFLWSRKFEVQNDLAAGCLDGEVAVGLVATNGVLYQLTWLAVHGDSLYLILCLGRDDGTRQNQNTLAADFSRTLDTLRWLS